MEWFRDVFWFGCEPKVHSANLLELVCLPANFPN